MNNLYLIIGEEEELLNFYLHDIQKKITYNEQSKITYDLNTDSFSDILDESSMISLFDNQKLIIGINFDPNKLTDSDTEYLQKYLSAKNQNVYIILIAPKVDARKSNYKILKENFTIIDTTKSNNS